MKKMGVQDVAEAVLERIKTRFPKDAELGSSDKALILRISRFHQAKRKLFSKDKRKATTKKKAEWERKSFLKVTKASPGGRPKKRASAVETSENDLLKKIRVLIEEHCSANSTNRRELLDKIVKNCRTNWKEKEDKGIIYWHSYIFDKVVF